MKLICYFHRAALLLVFPFLLSACGGGGSGEGAGNAESMLAPYLISSPQVISVENAPGEFDVTVTIEADGPSGIYSATVWLFNVDPLLPGAGVLYLTQVGVTNTWTGTTNPLIPLAAGTYKVVDILLHDADPMGLGASHRSVCPVFRLRVLLCLDRRLYFKFSTG